MIYNKTSQVLLALAGYPTKPCYHSITCNRGICMRGDVELHIFIEPAHFPQTHFPQDKDRLILSCEHDIKYHKETYPGYIFFGED